jgi:hypothetical protein
LSSFCPPRYITTYINTGSSLTCHTFHRLYSSRYQLQTGEEEAEGLMRGAAGVQQRMEELEGTPVGPELKQQLRKITHSLVQYIQRSHGLCLKGGRG